MNNDETIRLILETRGAEGLQELIDKANQAKVAFTSLYEVGERRAGTYQIVASAADAAFEKELGLAVEATRQQKIFNEFLDEGARKQTRFAGISDQSARGILQFSYAVQDFSTQIDRGLGPALATIQNNIPLLVTGLGFGAGVAGAVSLVTVGLGALIDRFGDTDEAAKKSTEQFKEMEKQAKATADAVAKMLAGPTSEELGQADESKWRQKFIGNLGSETLGGIRSELLQNNSSPQLPALRARRAALQRQLETMSGGADPSGAASRDISAQLAQVNAQIASAEQAGIGMTDSMIQDLATGGRTAFEDVFNALPPGAIRDRIAGGSADAFNRFQQGQENIRQAESTRRGDALIQQQSASDAADIGKQIREQAQREQAAAKERDRQAAADERERQQLNLQGQRNQDAAREAAERQAERDRREAEKAAKEAPLNDMQARIGQAAGRNGVSLNDVQLADAAREALNLANAGADANEAAIAALQGTVAEMIATRQRIAQQAAAIRMFGMQMGGLQQQSETFFGMW